MWNDMSPEQRKALWSAAGYVGEPVASKETDTAAYHTTDETGNVINVVYNKSNGTIVKQENLGPIGKDSDKGTPGIDKEVQSFQNDAAGLIEKLDSANMTWKTAWDTLHLKYPTAPAEAIDLALGLERRKLLEGK
jgi:hypothetical protein